ncbi:MAG: pyrroline-5-carboxylate reductase [Treponema sp.]|nr:pyrroline-5-carboxylate reductase [Treponema sp.]
MITTTIACIGCGVMGGALMRAIASVVTAKNITVSAATAEEAKAFAASIGCNAAESNALAVKNAKIVFLAVKPAFVTTVLQEISGSLLPDATIVSMAAGLPIETLHKTLNSATPAGNTHSLVRIMPNMPAAVGEAMIALAANSSAHSYDVEAVKELLESAGKVEQVDEKLMDCVTAVSGSGPAFVFMFIEALADAAVRFGMPRKQAYIYAAQTVKGSASMMLETGRLPADLKDGVCSPAGTTIEGVAALERTGLRNSVIEAVTATYEKSVALGKK